jgi:hypothetical protein
MNDENLKKGKKIKTAEEARNMGKKGGIASGESKRRRKTLREELMLLLENGDVQKRMCLALLDEALNGNRTGSVKGAFETVRDTLGEKPAEKMQLDGGIKFTFGDAEDYSE